MHIISQYIRSQLDCMANIWGRENRPPEHKVSSLAEGEHGSVRVRLPWPQMLPCCDEPRAPFSAALPSAHPPHLSLL